MTDWHRNDALLAAQLTEGHRYAEVVGAGFRTAGLTVEVTPPSMRATIADRHAYDDEADLLVAGRIIEVKSRGFHFTDDPASFPFPTAFVGTVAAWSAKQRPRCAVVLISQSTEAMLVAPLSSRAEWVEVSNVDRVRRISVRSLAVPRAALRRFAELVVWLHERSGGTP